MADEINGWKPPVIYVLGENRHRIATQEDIDRLTDYARIVGTMLNNVEREVQEARRMLNEFRGYKP